MNIFEVSTRGKIRFPHNGLISVEDLWDLSPQSLDTIYRTLNAKVKKCNEESLLQAKTDEDTALDLQIQIVKHVFDVKQAELLARQEIAKRREQKSRLMSLIAKKQDEELEGKPVEDLMKMLDEIDV